MVIKDKIVTAFIDKIAKDLELEIKGSIDLHLKNKKTGETLNTYSIPISTKLNFLEKRKKKN